MLLTNIDSLIHETHIDRRQKSLKPKKIRKVDQRSKLNVQQRGKLYQPIKFLISFRIFNLI